MNLTKQRYQLIRSLKASLSSSNASTLMRAAMSSCAQPQLSQTTTPPFLTTPLTRGDRRVLLGRRVGLLNNQPLLVSTEMQMLLPPSIFSIRPRHMSDSSEGKNSPSDIGSIVDLDSVNMADTAASVSGYISGSSEPLNTFWPLSHPMMSFIDFCHQMSGLPYWGTIVVMTIGLRFILFPMAVKTQQAAARMALARPEMEKLSEAMKNDPRSDELEVKQRYTKQIQEVFVKHKVKPLRMFAMPVIQIPIFLVVFTALKDMGTMFPGFAEGGTLWFTDLAAADVTMVLPVLNSLSFLLMLEIGADGMAADPNKTVFKNAMRATAVLMVPMTMSLPQGLFVYWSTSNAFSIVQTFIMKHDSVRKFLDIPAPPPAPPAEELGNPFMRVYELAKKEMGEDKTAKAEIIDGLKPPPAPLVPQKSSSESKDPPKVFSAPPRHRKK